MLNPIVVTGKGQREVQVAFDDIIRALNNQISKGLLGGGTSDAIASGINRIGEITRPEPEGTAGTYDILSDTPSSKTGKGGYFVRVDPGETELVYDLIVASLVGNDSGVAGSTVKDALDNLAALIADSNIDGGSAVSVYLPTQGIDGGNA